MNQSNINKSYDEIRKIVIDDLKNELKLWTIVKISNWAGDAHYSKKSLEKRMLKRKQCKKNCVTILKLLRKMGY